jgi:hypothetical protein
VTGLGLGRSSAEEASLPGETDARLSQGYWLTRFLFLRLLGLVYFVAFLCLTQQFRPLIGRSGLLPAQAFLDRIALAYGHGLSTALRLPTLFWLNSSDAALGAGCWLGLLLSLSVVLGLANLPVLATLWLLYMSFVHVGQVFYGYGWETLLLETGFLAIFLAPPWRPGPFPERSPPPRVVIWLLRWLAFRLMFGAGLIKLRGDSCWRDLSCLVYHYETQPLPNPLSFYLHQLPRWFHQGEVLFNHVVEVIVPWMVFGPRRLRTLAGILLVLFQGLLILSGNLSFLNWLTLAVCLACFDDGSLARIFPHSLTARVVGLPREETGARRAVVYTLAAVVAVLSVNPVANMLSPGQLMNASFDPFDLVNTYGAFGGVLRERHEIVLQGTDDERPDDRARWLDYEFKCKPGDVERHPCVVSPYHYRLDWQIWFAAMSDASEQPWLVGLVAKLLEGDAATLDLLAAGPFRERPPRYIRARLYRYEFTRVGEPGRAWWRRTLIGEYLPPLSREDPRLREFLALLPGGEP